MVMNGMEETVTMYAEGHRLRRLDQLANVSAAQLFSRIRRAIAEPGGAGIMEAVLGVALISVIGIFIPGRWGLLGFQPHPLWIVVIAIALRYGVGPGYVAGALAALSYTLFLCVNPGQGVHLPGTSDLSQPLFLFVGGVLIGELVRAHHQELTVLHEQNDHLQETLLGILTDQQALTDANAALDSQVASEPTSLHDFYELAKKVNTQCAQTVYPAILDVVSDALEAEACALYLWHDGQLHLHLGLPETYPARPDTLSVETGLAGMAFRDGRTVSIRDRLFTAGARVITDDSFMLAGPLKDREGHVSGVVTVERLPFLKLNAASIRLFDALLEWSSTAVANAHDYETSRVNAKSFTGEDRNEDAVASALPVTETLTRLQDAFVLAHQERLPLSLLVIQIEEHSAEISHLIPAFLHMLGLTVRRCMRHVDSFGLLDQFETYVLLLPGMPADGARIVARCIQAELNDMTRHADCPLTVCLGTATLEGQASPEELLAQALPEVLMNASPIPVHAT